MNEVVLGWRRMAGHFYRALVQPIAIAGRRSLVRSILLQPRIFDLASLLLQLRDLRRVRRIKRSQTAASSDHHGRAHAHNAGITMGKEIGRSRRPEAIYQVLTTPARDLGNEELLIVGPRTILELFIAWTYGYRAANITGIDLYSTNPKIRVMNMEAMTFDDERFDAVAMSATLAYAQSTRTALQNVARVLRPGGRFVFHAVYDPDSPDWLESVRRGADIHAMLDALGFSVYFHTSEDKVNSQGRRQTAHIFGYLKDDPEAMPLDALKFGTGPR